MKKERTLVCRAELIKTNTEHKMEVMAVNMVCHASNFFYIYIYNCCRIFPFFSLQDEAYSLFSIQIGWTTKQAKINSSVASQGFCVHKFKKHSWWQEHLKEKIKAEQGKVTFVEEKLQAAEAKHSTSLTALMTQVKPPSNTILIMFSKPTHKPCSSTKRDPHFFPKIDGS